MLTPASHAECLLNEIVVLCLRVERQADWPDEVRFRGGKLQSQEGDVVVLIGSVRVVLFVGNLLLDRNVDRRVGIAHHFIDQTVVAIFFGCRVPFSESNAGQRPSGGQILSVDAMRSWKEKNFC